MLTRFLALIAVIFFGSISMASITVVVTVYPKEVKTKYKRASSLANLDRFIKLEGDQLDRYGLKDVEYYLDKEVFWDSGLELLESWNSEIEKAFGSGENTVSIKNSSLTEREKSVIKTLLSRVDGLSQVVDLPNFELEFSTHFVLELKTAGLPNEVRFLDRSDKVDSSFLEFKPQPSQDSKLAIERLMEKLVQPTSLIVSESNLNNVDSLRINAEASRIAAEYLQERQKKQRMFMSRYAKMVESDRFKIGAIPEGGLGFEKFPKEFQSAIRSDSRYAKYAADDLRLINYTVHFGIKVKYGLNGSKQSVFIALPF